MDAINELELRSLLIQKGTTQSLINEVVKQAKNSSIPWEERRSYWAFLYDCGAHKTLCEIYSSSLREKQQVPFALLIELFGHSKVKLGNKFFEALIKGLKKQGSEIDILTAHSLDHRDSRLQQMRTDILEARLEKRDEFKRGLLEKFEFLMSERMIEQAGRVLRRSIELYPDDPDLLHLKQNFDEQWAREILASHVSEVTAPNMDSWLVHDLSTRDKEMIQVFLDAGRTIASSRPDVADELVIALIFMEQFNAALEMIPLGTPGAHQDWLRVELLLLTRRFVDGLDELGKLEMKYASDPEAAFAISYLRARLLYGIGQHSAAIEVMRSIVHVRPNYRSAHAYVIEWSQGATWE